MSKRIFLKIQHLLIKTYLTLAILFVVCMAILHFPEFTEVIHYASIIDISVFVYVLSFAFISYFFRTIRWLLYIRKKEEKANNLHHSIIYLSGFAFTASPGKSGELMRAPHLSRLQVPFNYTLACFISERLLDVIIVLNLGVYAIVIVTGNSLFFLSSVILLATPFFLNPLLSMHWIAQYTQKSTFIIHSLPLWKVRITCLSILLTFAAWFTQGVILYVILLALGVEISLFTAVSIYCLSLLIGAASLIPGGLGATELGMSWLLTQVGIPADIALAAALVTRVLTLWPIMLTGVMCSGILIKKNATSGK